MSRLDLLNLALHASMLESGKLRPLAVTTRERLDGLPQVPTVAQAGLPNFELESWVALYVPTGTPAAVIQKLSQDVKRSMESPETRQRADQAGVDGGSPAAGGGDADGQGDCKR